MIKKFIKGNLMFFMGMVFGSVVSTTTTIMITMGYFGISETVSIYQSSLCSGSSK